METYLDLIREVGKRASVNCCDGFSESMHRQDAHSVLQWIIADPELLDQLIRSALILRAEF